MNRKAHTKYEGKDKRRAERRAREAQKRRIRYSREG